MNEQERDAKRWHTLMLMIDEDQVRLMTAFCTESGLNSDEAHALVDQHLLKEIE